MKRNAYYQIRVEPELRDAFTAAAASQDRTAAQLVRDFMRDYVKRHGQPDLFAPGPATPRSSQGRKAAKRTLDGRHT